MSHLVHTVCHRRGLGGTLARPSAHWLTRSSARIPSRVLSLQLLFQGHDRFELGPAWLQVRGFHGSCKAALGAARPSSETPAPVDPVASDTNKTALQVGFKEKAKENVKTATYGSVIVIGVGITAVVLYTVFSELFSSSSPVKLFQMASEKCVQHPRVQDLLGEPIKAFGEETRRGRRRHVSHMEYVDKEGRKGIRVQFYLQGLRKRGTAQIDAREDESGSMKTRFIIVTADDLLGTSVVVEDNR